MSEMSNMKIQENEGTTTKAFKAKNIAGVITTVARLYLESKYDKTKKRQF